MNFITKHKQYVLLTAAVLSSAFLLFWSIVIYPKGTNDADSKPSADKVVLYAKSKINVYDCQSESCNIIQSDFRGATWAFEPQTIISEWLPVTIASGKLGHIKTAEFTQEKPNIISLQKSGNARSCPSLDCKTLGQFKAGDSFSVFKSDDKGDWYSVEGGDVKDRNKIVVYYLHKSLFEDSGTLANPIIKPKGISIPPTSNQSGPPITLYAKTAISIYEKPSESAKVLTQYQQYTYWEFPYTPTGIWYLVLTEDKLQGYVRASDMTAEAPPTPTPDSAHCSLTYDYSIGRVDGFWTEKGFDRKTLTDLVTYSEKQWEDTIDKNLFEYKSDSANKIDFIVDDYFKVNQGQDQYGRATTKNYQNGTPLNEFQIYMFSQVFEYASRPSFIYYGDSTGNNKDLTANVITNTIMHELGHVIGLGHLTPPQAVMNSGENHIPASKLPTLTQDDITALKDWCASNQPWPSPSPSR